MGRAGALSASNSGDSALDTGMSRLGLDDNELAILADDHSRLQGLTILYVMTHLVAAENPADRLNQLQLERFIAARGRLPPAPTSLANSSGIFLGADFASDLARPGAALYGVNPTPGRPNPMRDTVRLMVPRAGGAGRAAGERRWVTTGPGRHGGPAGSRRRRSAMRMVFTAACRIAEQPPLTAAPSDW